MICVLAAGAAVANYATGTVIVPGVPFQGVDFDRLQEWDPLRRAWLSGRVSPLAPPAAPSPLADEFKPATPGIVRSRRKTARTKKG